MIENIAARHLAGGRVRRRGHRARPAAGIGPGAGHRLDIDDDPGLRARWRSFSGVVQPVLSIAQRCRCRLRLIVGIDGRQPDDHSSACLAIFRAAAQCPTTGPVYNLVADGYEGLLKIGLKFPITAMLTALLAAIPLWWLGTNIETGFMPDMDEGAFVLDYEMPVGTSLAQTDKVMRRVEAVLQSTPDISGYIRRTGAELGFFATEAYTGDVLVSLKQAALRRPAEEIFEVLREGQGRYTEAETEFVPLVQDQINDLAGVASPIEVKVFGPDVGKLRRPGRTRSARSSRRSKVWRT